MLSFWIFSLRQLNLLWRSLGVLQRLFQLTFAISLWVRYYYQLLSWMEVASLGSNPWTVWLLLYKMRVILCFEWIHAFPSTWELWTLSFVKISLGHSFFFFFCLFTFSHTYIQHMEVPEPGLENGAAAAVSHSHSNTRSELHMQPVATACGHARSLTHWVRPGVKPASSWKPHRVLNPLSHNGNSLRHSFYLLVSIFNVIRIYGWTRNQENLVPEDFSPKEA